MLQTEIAVIATEAEYITLIQAMRKAIPSMGLMRKVSFISDINLTNPEVFCKVFEDNQSCIAIADCNKFPPRKKHIHIKYHHYEDLYKRHYSDMLY